MPESLVSEILNILSKRSTKIKAVRNTIRHYVSHAEREQHTDVYHIHYGWSGEISGFHKEFRTGPIPNRSELIRVGAAPEISETGQSLLFEPVSYKLKQGFVWGRPVFVPG